jgi:hypothetical protein
MQFKCALVKDTSAHLSSEAGGGVPQVRSYLALIWHKCARELEPLQKPPNLLMFFVPKETMPSSPARKH